MANSSVELCPWCGKKHDRRKGCSLIPPIVSDPFEKYDRFMRDTLIGQSGLPPRFFDNLPPISNTTTPWQFENVNCRCVMPDPPEPPSCDCLCEQHHVGDDGECWQCDDCPQWGGAPLPARNPWYGEAFDSFIIDDPVKNSSADTATGERLNRIGAMFGVRRRRFGESDQAFRTRVFDELSPPPPRRPRISSITIADMENATRRIKRMMDEGLKRPFIGIDAAFRRTGDQVDALSWMMGRLPVQAFPNARGAPRALWPLFNLLWVTAQICSPHHDMGCASCIALGKPVRKKGDPTECPKCGVPAGYRGDYLTTGVREEEEPDLQFDQRNIRQRVTLTRRNFRRESYADQFGRRWYVWREYK